MENHTLFFRKFGKMSQNLSSAAVVIGALRVKVCRGNQTHLVHKNFQGIKQGIFKSEHHARVYGIALNILLFYTLLPESQRM